MTFGNTPYGHFYTQKTSPYDNGGRPNETMRLHRRILELPNGNLLTTLYGWFEGDDEPSGYIPTMHKMRFVLLLSINRGRHWDVVYDFGYWGSKQGRYTYGRKFQLSADI